jgi:hypothetical protein
MSQDLHFSNFQFSPLDVNPANTAAFAETFRVNSMYSKNGFAIADQGYQVHNLSVDAKVMKGFRKQDWIGIGLKMDVVNSGNNSGTKNLGNLNEPNPVVQNWLNTKISAAYHYSLNETQSKIITFGIQMTHSSRQFSLGNSEIRYEYNLGESDPEREYLNYQNINNYQFKFRDIAVGFLYYAKFKKSELKLGTALGGIFHTTTFINSHSNDTVDAKLYSLKIHGEYKVIVTQKTYIEPAFYFNNLYKISTLVINTHAWYQVKPDKNVRIGAGLGFRNTRDLIFYLGTKVKGFQVGLVFDLNFNSESIYYGNGFGGFELCARYLGKINKKAKV